MSSNNAMYEGSGEYPLSIKADATKIVPTESVGCATVTIDPVKNDLAWVTVQGAEIDKATDSSGAQLESQTVKSKLPSPQP